MEAVGIIDMAINQAAQQTTTLVGQLLSIARLPDTLVLVEGISDVLHLSIRQIVQPQPLDVKELAKPIEGIDPSVARLPQGAAHPGVALEGIAAVDRENKDHNRAVAEGIAELLLVLPLRRPEAMPH